MILIIGGAYQGKRAFAQAQFGLSEAEIEICGDTLPQLDKPGLASVEEFVLTAQKAGLNPLQWLREHEESLRDKVLICQDIFCGVVPMGADMRAWRQDTGLVCQYLAGLAEQVWRVYCGLGQRIR